MTTQSRSSKCIHNRHHLSLLFRQTGGGGRGGGGGGPNHKLIYFMHLVGKYRIFNSQNKICNCMILYSLYGGKWSEPLK